MRRYRQAAKAETGGDEGYYLGKLPGMRVRLTSLGLGILMSVVTRRGDLPDDVVEDALRLYATVASQ